VYWYRKRKAVTCTNNQRVTSFATSWRNLSENDNL